LDYATFYEVHLGRDLSLLYYVAVCKAEFWIHAFGEFEDERRVCELEEIDLLDEVTIDEESHLASEGIRQFLDDVKVARNRVIFKP
jgi:hypothetical protein